MTQSLTAPDLYHIGVLQALDNARKDMDKVRKRRAPFEKKLEQNPDFIAGLDKDIMEIKEEIEQLNC